MLKLHECVSFIIIDQQGRVLLEQRRLDKESDPGLMAVPGGHSEPNETQIDTLKREMAEELSLTPIEHQYVCTLIHPSSIEHQQIHYYAVTKWAGTLQCHEAEAMHWVNLDAIERIDVAADRIAVTEYLRLFA